MSVLLTFLRDSDSIVARQSIVSGTNVFVSVLQEMALQFHRKGKIEIWLEELWLWMAKLKDAIFTIAVQNPLASKRVDSCLRVPGDDDSPHLSLLIQNKGKDPLVVTISAPDFTRLDKTKVQLKQKDDAKMENLVYSQAELGVVYYGMVMYCRHAYVLPPMQNFGLLIVLLFH